MADPAPKSAGPKFADLLPRVVSGGVLMVVAGLGLWLGGLVLSLLLSLLGAAMLWEYFRLIVRLSQAVSLIAATAAAALLAVALVLEHYYAPHANNLALAPAVSALIVLAICVALVITMVHKSRLEVGFGALIPLGAFLFFYIHQSAPPVMWLVVATVVATDVAGYFFGKLIGGPKFWPSLSPNKTWSGAAGGWLMAALIGLVVTWGEGFWDVAIAIFFLVAVSFAAQMADIAESALKRRAGVKDSSNLLPGHGGVLDRFDGMIGGFGMAGLIFVTIGVSMGSA